MVACIAGGSPSGGGGIHSRLGSRSTRYIVHPHCARSGSGAVPLRARRDSPGANDLVGFPAKILAMRSSAARAADVPLPGGRD